MEGNKRKADDGDNRDDKRVKTKKQWRVPRKNDHGAVRARAIQPGDSGIWATCNKGKEGKCIFELRNLFLAYAEELYGPAFAAEPEPEEPDAADGASTTIEDEIQAEVADIRKPSAVQLFTPVQLDVQCVVFFKTVEPIEPVAFVKSICEDAASGKARRRTRFTKRLSPMTLMGRASVDGLAKVATDVLAPHFHQEPIQKKKFAIRPTLRNHNILTRDSVIKLVAPIVGPGHEVNLTNYDLLIVVEIYQNICGVSVVDASFERLKRFNIAEIYDPTPQDTVKEGRKQSAESAKDEAGPPPVDLT